MKKEEMRKGKRIKTAPTMSAAEEKPEGVAVDAIEAKLKEVRNACQTIKYCNLFE